MRPLQIKDIIILLINRSIKQRKVELMWGLCIDTLEEK